MTDARIKYETPQLHAYGALTRLVQTGSDTGTDMNGMTMPAVP